MDGNIESALPQITGTITKMVEISGSLSMPQSIKVAESYDELRDKPVLNNVTIEGDKVSEDYHLQGEMKALTEQEIEQ